MMSGTEMMKAVLIDLEGNANTVWVDARVEIGELGTFELVDFSERDSTTAEGEIVEIDY